MTHQQPVSSRFQRVRYEWSPHEGRCWWWHSPESAEDSGKEIKMVYYSESPNILEIVWSFIVQLLHFILNLSQTENNQALRNVWKTVTSPVSRWMISKACLTMRTVSSFLPLLRPCIIMEFVTRSTMGHWALRKRLAAYLPLEWGRYLAYFSFTAM